MSDRRAGQVPIFRKHRQNGNGMIQVTFTDIDDKRTEVLYDGIKVGTIERLNDGQYHAIRTGKNPLFDSKVSCIQSATELFSTKYMK